MNEFEYAFSLFGLLLGFTLVEVLSGLVRTIKASSRLHAQGKAAVRLGWFTPLLGLFVLLDITSFWVNLWELRDVLAMGFDTAFGILLVAGVYYFAASMIFPAFPESWPDLDEWFWRHRRQVIGALAVANLLFIAFLEAFSPERSMGTILLQLLYFSVLATAALPRNKWVVGASLSFLSLVYLLSAISQAISRAGWPRIM